MSAKELFVVERICDCQKINGVWKWQVKWQGERLCMLLFEIGNDVGYSEAEKSWEPLSSFQDQDWALQFKKVIDTHTHTRI